MKPVQLKNPPLVSEFYSGEKDLIMGGLGMVDGSLQDGTYIRLKQFDHGIHLAFKPLVVGMFVSEEDEKGPRAGLIHFAGTVRVAYDNVSQVAMQQSKGWAEETHVTRVKEMIEVFPPAAKFGKKNGIRCSTGVEAMFNYHDTPQKFWSGDGAKEASSFVIKTLGEFLGVEFDNEVEVRTTLKKFYEACLERLIPKPKGDGGDVVPLFDN